MFVRELRARPRSARDRVVQPRGPGAAWRNRPQARLAKGSAAAFARWPAARCRRAKRPGSGGAVSQQVCVIDGWE
jgi:hypothetical protein